MSLSDDYSKNIAMAVLMFAVLKSRSILWLYSGSKTRNFLYLATVCYVKFCFVNFFILLYCMGHYFYVFCEELLCGLAICY